VSSGLERGILAIEHMTIQRMERVGIVVDDVAAATEFFVELGLELQGERPVEGRWLDRVVGARRRPGRDRDPADPGRPRTTRADEVPHAADPGRQPARTGEHTRHPRVAFAVEHIDAVVASPRARGPEHVGELERYEDSYRPPCHVRGPEGIIVELAEQIG
jgi:catechol 2,3-dioxygenase-like lactoylglutathione lyase family enzyme